MFSSSYSLANKTVPQNNTISKLEWTNSGCKTHCILSFSAS